MRMPRESCQVEKLHEKLAGKLLPHAGKPSTRKNRKETKKNGHTTFSLFPPSLFYFGLFFFSFSSTSVEAHCKRKQNFPSERKRKRKYRAPPLQRSDDAFLCMFTCICYNYVALLRQVAPLQGVYLYIIPSHHILAYLILLCFFFILFYFVLIYLKLSRITCYF